MNKCASRPQWVKWHIARNVTLVRANKIWTFLQKTYHFQYCINFTYLSYTIGLGDKGLIRIMTDQNSRSWGHIGVPECARASMNRNGQCYIEISQTKGVTKVNSPGADAVMFSEIYVNTMAGDALAPCVARSSAAMVLTMQDYQLTQHGLVMPYGDTDLSQHWYR